MDYSRDERQPYVAWRGQLMVRRRDKASGEICASGSSLKLPAYVGTWDSTSRSPTTREDAAWSGRSDTPSTAARNYRPVLADPLSHPPQLYRTPLDFPIEMMRMDK